MAISSNALAIVINEVESNPAGQDSGNEWVELYSEEEINLEDYYLENGDGGRYNLSGSFDGYMVITFPGLWLDNQNETVTLKRDEEIVYRTEAFDDAQNNNKTWNFCDGEWEFIIGTKGYENACPSGGAINTTNNTNNNTGQNNNTGTSTNNQSNISVSSKNKNNEETEVEVTNLNTNTEIQNTQVRQTKQKIVLNQKEEVKEEKSFVSKEEEVRLWVIYAFTGFCIILIITLLLNKREV